MKKVLAFFGAFNPPTVAHIDMANIARKATGCEGVIFIPSQNTYILNTQGKGWAYGNEHRLEMLANIARRRRWMKVSAHDIDAVYQPRTYETLCHLREQGYEPRLLVGADVLASFEAAWENVDKIIHEFGVVCVDRYDNGYAAAVINNSPFLQQFRDGIQIISCSGVDLGISSSDVRDTLDELWALRDELEEMIPHEIFNGLVEPYKPMRGKEYET